MDARMFARFGPNPWSHRSVRSAASAWSVLSFGSAGSILSFGSAGSILSINSAGSILSINSGGSILSIGSSRGILTRHQPGSADEGMAINAAPQLTPVRDVRA